MLRTFPRLFLLTFHRSTRHELHPLLAAVLQRLLYLVVAKQEAKKCAVAAINLAVLPHANQPTFGFRAEQEKRERERREEEEEKEEEEKEEEEGRED
mgnify:CR=1 FL=1